MSKDIDEGASNDDGLESNEDVSSSVFQVDEDHIESAPNNDSFLIEKTVKKNEDTRYLSIDNQVW